MLAANIGSDTRPYVTFRLPGQDAWVGWCAPVTCSDPGLGRVGESRVPGTPTIEQLVAAHVDRRLLPCPQVCDERQLIPEISRPDGGIYRVAIESYDPKPMRVSVGARPQRPQRAVLLACTEAGCDGARRVPLADYPSYSTRDEWVMAADPDGARVVLATASYSPWTIFVVAL